MIFFYTILCISGLTCDNQPPDPLNLNNTIYLPIVPVLKAIRHPVGSKVDYKCTTECPSDGDGKITMLCDQNGEWNQIIDPPALSQDTGTENWVYYRFLSKFS